MSNDDPVTEWMNQLRDADTGAAEKLWNHFISRLCMSAKGRLGAQSRRVYDEEDAALSAFWSVCKRVADDRFPNLKDRDSLWRLLLVITARKVMYRHRFDTQTRRDVRRNLDNLIFVESGNPAAEHVDRLPCREPSPEFTAELQDTYDSLIEGLDDAQAKQVVALRMEGYTDAEIAKQLDCSKRTVQRRVEIVRRHWRKLEEPSDDA